VIRPKSPIYPEESLPTRHLRFGIVFSQQCWSQMTQMDAKTTNASLCLHGSG
jgi:hypothetical protein